MDSSCCYKTDILEVVVDNREMAVGRVSEWWAALLRVDSMSWVENDWDRNGYWWQETSIFLSKMIWQYVSKAITVPVPFDPIIQLLEI